MFCTRQNLHRRYNRSTQLAPPVQYLLDTVAPTVGLKAQAGSTPGSPRDDCIVLVTLVAGVASVAGVRGFHLHCG